MFSAELTREFSLAQLGGYTIKEEYVLEEWYKGFRLERLKFLIKTKTLMWGVVFEDGYLQRVSRVLW